ncbi:MAG: Fibronectin type III domain protein [Candidatus Wolfebacteria bacterium GW2011_GWA2_47_9b]|nr:MAG: Fibronectin type III domain protein [Candidatus Wolfebacteria bacterium GW2011_GWE2_47_12]KKU65681.1 MAG: Fibronectin type III domain protein [Candidatus Wolfebacteria bacterium GW2011_GWD2_47_17]KKU89710.1 MAG: Fibronectin type III domain protein [Candidatus Wolfebacteria bacterium GW2011_GWA2_47_9b]
MQKQILKIFFFSAIFFAVPNSSQATIIFEDDFDAQADWQPTCLVCGKNEDGYNGGGDLSGTPINWSYWRNDEYWNPATGDPTKQPTLKISTDQYSGQGGKSLQVWNESNNGHSGDGWGADGQLAKYLGGEFDDIFLQMKIKMSPTFQFKRNH